MRRWLCTTALLLSSSCFAALPPLWQSSAQIEGLLKQMAQHLDCNEMIESIVKSEQGYSLKTSKTRWFVQVRSQPVQRLGRLEYEYLFTQIE